MLQQRSPSWSGSSTLLLDLEEEEGEDVVAPVIRETPPVSAIYLIGMLMYNF